MKLLIILFFHKMKDTFFRLLLLPTLVLLLLISFGKAKAQTTYTLPDTNFRNKLLTDYPDLMTGNALNIVAAKAFNGVLNISNSNIKNVSGIQFFINVNTLNLSNNNISTIPDISGLTQLVNFYAFNNKLVSLPSFATLINLSNFQVQYNLLTALPPLNTLTKLTNIYCNDNKLTKLPDISPLHNLDVLVIGNNPFTSLPDFSPLQNLRQLHINQTGIDTVRGLENLTHLEVLYAWGNNIRDLSMLNANTSLNTFQVFDNDLTTLPILSNKPALSYVSFANNHLTFEDILPLKPLSTFSYFAYSPQKNIYLPSFVSTVNSSITLSANIDEGVISNQYKWFKDSILIDSNQTGKKFFSSLKLSDSGTYKVVVRNPDLPELTLESVTASVKVNPCFTLSGFSMNTYNETCDRGSDINFTFSAISNGASFTYAIIPFPGTDTLRALSPSFKAIPPGAYKIRVTDGKNCEAEKPFSVRKPASCDEVFTPDGDGVMDTYYIEDTGTVRIYDSKRNLINTFTAPREWNGVKSDGSLADAGYYAIVINGKKVIRITLIR